MQAKIFALGNFKNPYYGGVTGFDGKDFEGKKRVAAGCHKTENKINADNRNLAVAA